MLHKAWNSKGEMPFCFPRSSIKFQGHTVQNITDFDPNWVFPDCRPVAAFKSLRFALFMQTNKFVLIDTTAVTLGEGHGKAIQYISPDLSILFVKYLRFSWNGFVVKDKTLCDNGHTGCKSGGNELETWSHPRPGWLKYVYSCYILQIEAT